MTKATATIGAGSKNAKRNLAVKKRTSIGRSIRSRPSNKHKRRNWKRYGGQGL